MDECFLPGLVPQVHHHQIDAARSEPVDLRLDVGDPKGHVVHALAVALEEPREEAVGRGGHQLHLASAREPVLDEPEALLRLVGSVEKLRTEDVPVQRCRGGHVAHGHRNVVQARTSDQWKVTHWASPRLSSPQPERRSAIRAALPAVADEDERRPVERMRERVPLQHVELRPVQRIGRGAAGERRMRPRLRTGGGGIADGELALGPRVPREHLREPKLEVRTRFEHGHDDPVGFLPVAVPGQSRRDDGVVVRPHRAVVVGDRVVAEVFL